ncbi:hypothetical protein DY000_02049486 [Brassica cretica]|uniref:Protein kinase domain-containing protein n=1 Tax=Brassica cretica TaxID=69181 RepID=A0ABQ7F4X7_BRACR|nr:hypothetical protein DY000_02049486 [Brassica cretica]
MGQLLPRRHDTSKDNLCQAQTPTQAYTLADLKAGLWILELSFATQIVHVVIAGNAVEFFRKLDRYLDILTHALGYHDHSFASLKIMNKMYISWKECINLREVKVSYLMNDCINLLEESDVQNWCFQVFSCMPQRGYFHRDLKSENMFSKNVIIKITDLGVAWEVHSNIQSMSRHAGTWHQTYRLQSYVYTSKVDMWATGAILTKVVISSLFLFPEARYLSNIVYLQFS